MDRLEIFIETKKRVRTQMDLAKQTGISPQKISRAVNGHIELQEDEEQRIRNAWRLWDRIDFEVAE